MSADPENVAAIHAAATKAAVLGLVERLAPVRAASDRLMRDAQSLADVLPAEAPPGATDPVLVSRVQEAATMAEYYLDRLDKLLKGVRDAHGLEA